MDTALELFLLLVVPILLTKTTERGRFDFLHPYLREAWTCTLIVYTLAKLSGEPMARLYSMSDDRNPALVYVLVAFACAAVGCFYWAATGWILSKAETGPHEVALMFKDSPLLTRKRQKRIEADINGVAIYLKSLGMPIPQDIPPIGVDTTNPNPTAAGWSFNSQGDNKYYYNQFNLQPGALDKRDKITEAFSSFVIGRFIYKAPPPPPANAAQMTPQQFLSSIHTPEAMDQSYRWMTSVVVVQYLNHSYWNRPFAENEKPVCPDQGNGMSYYFWQMRERFGREFADRLAVFALRASVDKPYTGAHADADHPYRHYFYERLTLADSVIDNENAKMPEIDSILKACSWLPLT